MSIALIATAKENPQTPIPQDDPTLKVLTDLFKSATSAPAPQTHLNPALAILES